MGRKKLNRLKVNLFFYLDLDAAEQAQVADAVRCLLPSQLEKLFGERVKGMVMKEFADGVSSAGGIGRASASRPARARKKAPVISAPVIKPASEKPSSSNGSAACANGGPPNGKASHAPHPVLEQPAASAAKPASQDGGAGGNVVEQGDVYHEMGTMEF